MLQKERNGDFYRMPESNEEFTQIIQEFKSLKPGTFIGADTESTGLDYYRDRVVGVCLAYATKTNFIGYYLPIRHVGYNNLPKVRVLRFTNWVLKRFQTVWFNRPYDFSMLEKEEEVSIDDPVSHDAQIMAWECLYEKYPSLKKYYRRFCKEEIDSYAATVAAQQKRKKEINEDDTEENEHDFGKTDPRYTYTYAAEDPVATLKLFFKLQKLFPYVKNIYPLDNKVGEVLRQLTKQAFEIDYPVIERYLEKEQAKLRKLQREIYNIAGYQFNIGSSREKAQALMRFVTLTEKTDKGQWAVSIPVLQKIDHPLAKAIIEYSETVKFISSYLVPFLKTKGTPVRFNYKTVEAPCLTKESRVVVRGRGSVNISTVREGDKIYSGSGVWSDVTMSEEHESEVLKVKVEGHPGFRCTPWHPVYVEGKGWVRADELIGGDRIVYEPFIDQTSPEVLQVGQTFVSLDYLMGTCVGYACAIKEGKIRAYSRSWVVEDYASRIENTFKCLVHVEGNSLCIDSPQVSKFLELQFKRILSGGHVNKEYAEGVLTGIYDYGLGIRKAVHMSAHVKDLVLRLLSQLGIRVENKGSMRISRRVEGVAKRVFRGMSSPYRVRLSDQVKAKAALKVLDVSRDGRDKVYHIECSEHCYVADGLLHHNTGRIASGKSVGNSYYAPINVQCLAGDTVVTTPDGECFLEGVKPGMYVWNGSYFGQVLDVFSGKKMLFKVQLSDGTVIKASAGHRFLTYDNSKRLFERLEDLKIGSYVYKAETPQGDEGRWVLVCRITPLEEEPVWDLHMHKDHFYVANGLVVHNSVPKETEKLYIHPDETLGIKLTEESEGALGEYETKGGLRKAFAAPEGYVFVTCDYCVPLGTLVDTPTGKVPIKSLKVGQVVSTPYGPKRVMALSRVTKHPQVTIRLKSGEVLKCSPEHRIATLRGLSLEYKQAKDINGTEIIWTKSMGRVSMYRKIRVWITHMLNR